MSFELPISAKRKFRLSATCQSVKNSICQKKPQSAGSPLFARRFEIRWGTEKMF